MSAAGSFATVNSLHFPLTQFVWQCTVIPRSIPELQNHDEARHDQSPHRSEGLIVKVASDQ